MFLEIKKKKPNQTFHIKKNLKKNSVLQSWKQFEAKSAEKKENKQKGNNN